MEKHYHSIRRDYDIFLSELKANPQMGIIVAGEESCLYLVCIYDKSERENMTTDEIRIILRESGLVE